MRFLPFRTVYAPIDLKKATIYVKDGYSGNTGAKIGAVNNGAGYAAATTVLTVDGFTAAVTTGDLVTIAGSKVATGDDATNRLTRHRITAHTETAGATTSITISPGLSAAVVDDAVITVQPRELEVKIGQGNLNYTEKRNIDYILDRGRIDFVREGDQVPVEVKLDFVWEFLRAVSGAGTPTIEDALKKRGEASGWTSSGSDPCEPYCVDLEIWYNPPCSGVADETILLQEYRWEQLDHNIKDSQVSTSGKCNITEATVARLT